MSTIIQQLAERKDLFARYEKCETQKTWCLGCGNFRIQTAVKQALTLENIDPEKVVMVFDVGCSGNGSDKIELNTIHGMHGRAISLGAGVALANDELTVIATAGDGATFSEGIGHLVHAIRSNYKMVFIHHNNHNYGLTTGQPSSTSIKGEKMNSAPDGVILEPLNTLQLVLSLNPSFVARVFSGDLGTQMTEVIQKALRHNGFAYVEVLQSCPTYNRATPTAWYREKVKNIETLEAYDRGDIWAARKIADNNDVLYTGLLYENSKIPGFVEALPNRKNLTSSPVDEVIPRPIGELLKFFE